MVASLVEEMMEQRELSIEEIKRNTLMFNKKMIIKKVLYIFLSSIISLTILAGFIYMRVFNTSYRLWPGSNDLVVGLKINYSTAWVIRVPAYYQGYEIKEISYCNLGPNVKYVYCEDGIERIQYEAFAGENVEYIRLPNTLKIIKEYAFAHCNLKGISWNKTLEETIICANAFQDTKLEKLVLPEGVTQIGSCAFAHNDKLEKVILPDSLSRMGMGIFANCANLNEVKLPKYLELIPDLAFVNCTALEKINLHDNLVAIGQYAFCETPINEKYFPDTLYYSSYITDSDLERAKQEKRFGKSGSVFLLTEVYYDNKMAEYKTIVFNKKRALEYYVERTEIPIEVFQEPITSERIWIEGRYYVLPMDMEDFLSMDNWILYDEQHYVGDYMYRYYIHADSQRILGIECDESNNNTVTAFFINGNCQDNICNIVLPGGVLMTRMDLHYYYISSIVGTNSLAHFAREDWEFDLGSEQHPYDCRIHFNSDGEITKMSVHEKVSEEESEDANENSR